MIREIDEQDEHVVGALAAESGPLLRRKDRLDAVDIGDGQAERLAAKAFEPDRQIPEEPRIRPVVAESPRVRDAPGERSVQTVLGELLLRRRFQRERSPREQEGEGERDTRS